MEVVEVVVVVVNEIQLETAKNNIHAMLTKQAATGMPRDSPGVPCD